MPPVLVVLASAIGGIAAARWVIKTVRRVNEELERAQRAHVSETVAREAIPTLRRDPATGAYRPS